MGDDDYKYDARESRGGEGRRRNENKHAGVRRGKPAEQPACRRDISPLTLLFSLDFSFIRFLADALDCFMTVP